MLCNKYLKAVRIKRWIRSKESYGKVKCHRFFTIIPFSKSFMVTYWNVYVRSALDVTFQKILKTLLSNSKK
ncbi:hypothetical protein L1887_32353 [Cichorium endivia]|nr:hypothetical protein L1887_32353 [Cichorium endivia]